MSPNWDGKERRSDMFDKEFYDRMMEMHTDVKYIRTWVKDHDVKDDERFGEADKKISWLTKIAYMGVGGLVVLQVIIKLIKIG